LIQTKRSGAKGNAASLSSHEYGDQQSLPMTDVLNVVHMQGIAKSFPGVVALEGVDF
jgi:hypothetical protein